MPPKAKKVRINMKEFIAKHGISQEKPAATSNAKKTEDEEWEDETKSQNEEVAIKPQEKEKKKQQPSEEVKIQKKQPSEEKRKTGASKKQLTLKGQIKQVLNDIVEQRQKHSLPLQLINETSKEPKQIRLLEFFERVHLYYFKVFDLFKKTNPEMEQIMNKFSNKIQGGIRGLKQTRMAEMSSKKNVAKDAYSEKILKYYNMQLKLKDDQIKRKKTFRQNARGKFNGQIRQVQDFITANSRIVSQFILRQKFQSIIDNVVICNNQIIAKKEKECVQNQKSLFREWRKIKKERIMLEKIRRAEKIQRDEKWRKEMSEKFENNMGVLLNAFNIYDQIR